MGTRGYLLLDDLVDGGETVREVVGVEELLVSRLKKAIAVTEGLDSVVGQSHHRNGHATSPKQHQPAHRCTTAAARGSRSVDCDCSCN